MAKAYTDLEQSKRLAKILPIETADMFYINGGGQPVLTGWVKYKHDYDDAPCWSLAALFAVLPEGVIDICYTPNIQKENGKYSIAYGNDELLCISDNPIDACYELILKLHKLTLL